ncbi:hypothetical protein EGW08_007601, partial [Elysia chlorotica]
TGHAKSVEVVAFSPGSVYLCTGSWDRTAILWCVQTGCHIRTLVGHHSLVQSVAFSPNFQFLATGSWDYTVKVWTLDHIEGGNKHMTLIGHTGNVHSVAFSKIGMLASGSWDRTIRLWNPWTGKLLRLLEGHIGWVKAVTFSPDSIFVASAADDDFVKVWDIPSGECINTLEGNTDLAQHCAFTAKGLLVASGAAVSKIKKVNQKDNEEEGEGHQDNKEGQLMALLHQ